MKALTESLKATSVSHQVHQSLEETQKTNLLEPGIVPLVHHTLKVIPAHPTMIVSDHPMGETMCTTKIALADVPLLSHPTRLTASVSSKLLIAAKRETDAQDLPRERVATTLKLEVEGAPLETLNLQGEETTTKGITAAKGSLLLVRLRR